LHGLGHPRGATAGSPARFSLTLSCVDPQRNKNYRAALFGGKKADPIKARAAAGFALTEKPTPEMPLSQELRTLRQVAGRLQAVVRQRTRLVNQFHHLLALTFPELALLTKDLAAGWVLELVQRYPTARLLAAATPTDLANIPYLPDKQVAPLLQQARSSIASLDGATAAELVREQVRQLRDSTARQKRLENLLVTAYRALPQANHLDTIPGIGAVTAAVLTAFTLTIDRFATPAKWVAYFGVLPADVASGVDRDGQVVAAPLDHESARQRPGAALSVDGGPQRGALQRGGAAAVRPRGHQASAAESDRHRPCHAQALAAGLRRLEERPALRPRPLPLASAGPRGRS
jgi:transposase